MSEFVIVKDGARGMKEKRVLLYLENDAGVHRQVQLDVAIDLDVDVYVRANFDALFAAARSLPDRLWDGKRGKSLKSVYRTIARAGVVESRNPVANFNGFLAAMEAEIARSDRADEYADFKALVTGGNANQRRDLNALIGFLVLSTQMADD